MQPQNKRSIDPTEYHDTIQSTGKKLRLPKRKVAVMFGYNGTGYQGSQINPKMKTIEGQLLNAFLRAGCISLENSSDPSKVGLQRAARTDANVHACCNLVSLKLILNPISLTNPKYQTSSDHQDEPSTDHSIESLHQNLLTKHSKFHSLIQHVNQFLPAEIRIWNLVRVQNSFNCRTYCDSRVYQYSLPTWCFLPPKPGTQLHKKLSHRFHASDQPFEFNWWNNHSELLLDQDFKSIQFETKKEYRISQAMIHKIQSVLDKFKGTHNFHNFTVGQSFTQPNSIRIMKDLKLSEPLLVPLDPIHQHHSSSSDQSGPLFTEWISITFHGQSFMLHQIRKMVGLIILLCRTGAPTELVKELYGTKTVRIPKAPGIGLVLKKLNYSGYNKQISKINDKSQRSHLKQKNHHHSPSEEQKRSEADQAEEDNLLVWEPIELDQFDDLFEMFKSKVLIKQMHACEKNYQHHKGAEKERVEANEYCNDHDEGVSQADQKKQIVGLQRVAKQNHSLQNLKTREKEENSMKLEEGKSHGLETNYQLGGGEEAKKAIADGDRPLDLKAHDEEHEGEEKNVKVVADQSRDCLETPEVSVINENRPKVSQSNDVEDQGGDGDRNEEAKARIKEEQPREFGTQDQQGGMEERKVKADQMENEILDDSKPHLGESVEEVVAKEEKPDGSSDQPERSHLIDSVSSDVLACPPHLVLEPNFCGPTYVDPFGVWINYMDVSPGPDLEFLNPDATVPHS